MVKSLATGASLAVIGGFAGTSSFTANSAYISQYGGNVKEVLSAYKENSRLKVKILFVIKNN